MKKTSLFLTCSIFFLGFIVNPVSADQSDVIELTAAPDSITLLETVDSLDFYFDTTQLPESIEIENVRLQFEIREDLEVEVLLKLINAQDSNIIEALSAVKSGDRLITGLEKYYKDNIDNEGVLTFRFKADNLDSSAIFFIDNITLIVQYVEVDNIPPKINNIKVEELNQDSVVLSWETDKPTKSSIKYGKTSNYSSLLEAIIDEKEESEYQKEHSVLILNLSPGTTYHYQILVEDESSNSTISQDATFITKISTSKNILGDATGDNRLSKPENLTGEVYIANGNFEVRLIHLYF